MAFRLSAKEMDMIVNKLDSAHYNSVQSVRVAKGCPNCNAQCKNGCGVTCVAVFS